MSKKPCFKGSLERQHGKWDLNTLGVWKAAPFQYLIITVKVIALTEVSFSDTQYPTTVCEHTDSPWQALGA